MDRGEPSTSNGDPSQPPQEGELLKDLDNEQLNEALETYAQNYNLTAQKVKNIIFHIVKNPQTFATLIRKDPDAMAGLRMTRTRLHQLERIANRSIPAPELKPINVPRTFLDVNYGEEDEEDADYNPGNDATIEGDKEDDGSSGSSSDEEREKESEQTAEKPGNGTAEVPMGPGSIEQTAEFLTEVDNPIYPMFIRSVIGKEEDSATNEQLYNEDDDPEYMFQEFDDCLPEEEDEYEFRHDRATEIPRWELKALEQDFVDMPITLENIPVESRPPSKQSMLASDSKLTKPKMKPMAVNTDWSFAEEPILSTSAPQIPTPIEQPEIKIIKEIQTFAGSCSLLLPPDRLRFTDDELKALKVQLKKHIQLLTQCIAGTSQYPELIGPRNSAVQMLVDLSEKSKSMQDRPHSLFHIPNLQAALYSAHDIEACREVDLPLKNYNKTLPSKETMWVLARSQACRYPELLPRYSFMHPKPVSNLFLQSEQLLLALGLFQLHNVPHTTRTNGAFMRGKYPLIAEYFVPGKTLTQMKNFLRNIRTCSNPTILHKIIFQAERGIFDVKYRPDFGETGREEIPINWPSTLQPFWLKSLADIFQRGQMEITRVEMDGSVPDEANSSKETTVEQHKRAAVEKESAEGHIQKKRIKLDCELEERDGEETEPEIMALDSSNSNERNEPTVNEASNNADGRRRRNSSTCVEVGDQDETSNDQFHLTNPGTSADPPGINIDEKISNDERQEAAIPSTSAEPQSQQQKKSQRKLRVERNIAALHSPEARDATTRALVEAVYADFKQRMFMHQDKLRAVQSALHSADLSTAERFSLLWDQLGKSHPQLFYLFAAIAPEHELSPSLRTHPERLASKQALRMIHTIQIYMGGSRSTAHMKNTFKFLKDARALLTSEDKLFEMLQRHFGMKDEPLWRLLYREWMGAKCTDKVENWQYECLDLDNLLQAEPKTMDQHDFQYEQVKVPYRHDATERSRLRVRHGRVTMELNGKLRNVTIEYPQFAGDKERSLTNFAMEHGTEEGGQAKLQLGSAPCSSRNILTRTELPPSPPNSSITQLASKWTREMDAALLLGYSESGGDRKKCIAKLLESRIGKAITQAEAEMRLQSLLTIAKQLKQKIATSTTKA